MMTFTTPSLLERLNYVYDEDFATLDEGLEFIELNIEDRLSLVLDGLGITHLVKTDRKSLPAQMEVSRKKIFCSYFNDALEVKALKREFIRDILRRGQCKVRYYVDIQPAYNPESNKIHGLMYTIKWYEHER